MPNNYVLLDRIELNNTAASVTFDNIPQSGYTDLKVVVSARSTSTADWVGMSFNGTTTGYTQKHLQGTGSSAASFNTSDYQFAFINNQTGSTANVFAFGEAYIPNYRSSNFKSYSIDTAGEANATTAYAEVNAQLWSNTAAITSITLTSTGGSLASGSTFSLYGLAQVGTTPAIAPKADGGNVIGTDGTYWYHAFLSNGTFTPQTALSADVLVVAGGGGGGGSGHTGSGQNRGGGGGAGGLVAYSAQSLTTTNYVCTVGAGGTGGVTTSGTSTGNANDGVNGGNSTFGALGSAIGGGFGGGGGRVSGTAGSGGSGGGGNGGINGGGYTVGQGNTGGNGAGSFGAGGGGATALGGSATFPSNSPLPNGGNGTSTYSAYGLATSTGENISGTVWYAGGGTGVNGQGGNGGGGDNRQNGTANTGGGGGGCETLQVVGENGGAGGSGIVIIRYLVA